jgi:toxin-antitoxin system PIN domain toxin
MSKSSISSAFPDLNVWIALSSTRHAHHLKALGWLRGHQNILLTFCRYTQLGFLRLLTTEAVMGADTLTQVKAWEEYDRWLKTGLAVLLEEPLQLEQIFRSLTRRTSSSPKQRADAYLAAFSLGSGIPVVTFDHGLKSRLKDAILLLP